MLLTVPTPLSSKLAGMRGGRTLAAGASALAFVGGGAASGEGFGHPDSAAAPNVVLLPRAGTASITPPSRTSGGPRTG
jgi:hypothetical protein